jgi:hypothetical protein
MLARKAQPDRNRGRRPRGRKAPHGTTLINSRLHKGAKARVLVNIHYSVP